MVKAKIIILLLILNSFFAICQNTITYSDGIITRKFYTPKMELVSSNNIGKNVVIVYDKFYRSYKITFEDEESKQLMNLKYVQDYAEDVGLKMYLYVDINDGNREYLLTNQIKDGNTITLKRKETIFNKEDAPLILCYNIVFLKPNYISTN